MQRAPRLFLLPLVAIGCACADQKADAAASVGVAEEEEADAGYDAGPVSVDDMFANAMSGHKDKRYTADVERIKKEGVLRVLTVNDSTSYFLHRGVEAGFNYELAKVFADELGVRMEMVVPRAPRDLIPWLLQGRGDLIVAGTPIDAPRTSRVRMTRPYMRTALVVVTRKGRVPALKTVDDLPSATLVVHPSTAAMGRLRKLSAETGVSLNLSAALENFAPEDILDDVADGKADAAVVQARVATIELAHRDDLEIAMELPVGIVESAFAVRNETPKLFAAADDFLRRNYRGTVFNILYWRYHRTTKQAAGAREDELRADREGAITEWDDIFHREAEKYDLDWRLLVAQAFQESRLNPKAKSEYGAQGLMQIMPATAKELGVKDPWDPQQSIEGGAKYMRKLIDRFDEGDDVALKDRARFALASYNVGPGHVDDARKLATELGKDPNRWFDNVNQALRLLSKPRYFNKAKYGYCRGEEPFKYVSEIQTRYDAYVAVTTEQPPQ